MSKGTNQKLKLIYLIKIMLEKTDDTHGLTMPQILSELEAHDVSAERKSIYTDFETLRTLGIDIVQEQQGKVYSYHVASRQFEIAELKLLVDAIQSSKFITEKNRSSSSGNWKDLQALMRQSSFRGRYMFPAESRR